VIPKESPSTHAPADSNNQNSVSARNLADSVAHRYGKSEFWKVDSLAFTFHVEKEDQIFSRSWVWFPKIDSVVFRGIVRESEVLLGYRRSPFQQPNSTQQSLPSLQSPQDSARRAIDTWFVNDLHWLIFPLAMVWQPQVQFTRAELEPDSLTGKSLTQLTVQYPSQGGYTPGDAYDLFVDSTYAIAGWVFRKGGGDIPNLVTTWSAPQPVGPLHLSLYHEGLGIEIRQWFTQVRAGKMRSPQEASPKKK
jgi:hypothetical protein